MTRPSISLASYNPAREYIVDPPSNQVCPSRLISIVSSLAAEPPALCTPLRGSVDRRAIAVLASDVLPNRQRTVDLRGADRLVEPMCDKCGDPMVVALRVEQFVYFRCPKCGPITAVPKP